MKSKSAEDKSSSPMMTTSMSASSQNENNSSSSGSGLLRKGFHSTPDLKNGSIPSVIPLAELKAFQFKAKTDLDICIAKPLKEVNDQRGYFTLPGRKLKLPPPNHAPPPIPITSEVMVVKSPEKPQVSSPIMSSFKPENDYTEPNR